MKISIITILFFISFSSFSQKGTITVKKNQIDIIGIWNISSEEPKKSTEIFEFKENGDCLLLKENKNSTLLEAQKGQYSLHKDTLKIIFVNPSEEHSPEKVSFVFLVNTKSSIIELTPTEGTNVDMKGIKFLSMSKRKISSKK